MTPKLSNRMILALAGVVSVVGLADAAVDTDWDEFGLFVLVLVLVVVLAARISWGRPAVPLRGDLVAWLEERAVDGGESPEAVADRAVAAYRAGLTISPDDASSGS